MSPRPYKILYVEDNPSNRELVHRVLTDAGYLVVEAADGLSGIRVATQERPDLILMDIMLPGMDGHQVTTRIKSFPELAHTPIVALTAKVMPNDRVRALIAGCDGYIPKPVDVDRLPDQIAEFLEGKREALESDVEERLTLQQKYTQELAVQLEKRILELQKANAELRQTDELKSKFILMASHELKTPLAVIQGYLAIMKTSMGESGSTLNETTRISLVGIEKGIERFKAIIEDMLDVVRIESKTMPIHQEPTVVKETVMAAVYQLEPAAQERRMKIKVGSMRGVPIILADTQRLYQVFLNLLSNAIKYTPDGGKINISAKVVKGSDLAHYGQSIRSSQKYVHIVFKDNGIGISPEEQQRIFDMFYEVRDVSLHSTSKTHFLGSGLGLGLAITRGIVDAHGGALWVESEGFDKERCPGSQFHILLPINS